LIAQSRDDRAGGAGEARELGGALDGDVLDVLEPGSLGALVGPAEAEGAEVLVGSARPEVAHVAGDADLGVEE